MSTATIAVRRDWDRSERLWRSLWGLLRRRSGDEWPLTTVHSPLVKHEPTAQV